MNSKSKPEQSVLDERLLCQLQPPFAADHDECLQRLLALGANPNAVATEDYPACALSLAAKNADEQGVHCLLQAGALLVWPAAQDENEAGPLLVSTEKENRGCLDPLGATLESLGRCLTQRGLGVDRERIDRLDRIAHVLMDTAAQRQQGNMLLRGDPGSGHEPLNALLLEYIEHTPPSELSNPNTTHVALMGNIIYQALLLVPKGVDVLPAVAMGQWDHLPFSRWEWHEDLPALGHYVKSLAQAWVLEQSPSANISRPHYRL